MGSSSVGFSAGISRRRFGQLGAGAAAVAAAGVLLTSCSDDSSSSDSTTTLAAAATKDPGPVWTPVPIPTQVEVTEGMVDVGGAQIYYWDTGGTGHPIVLLHAASQSAAAWGYQQPVLADAGHRVIAYSRRGYFRSETTDPANTGTAVADLGALIEHLGLDTVDLLGTAAGGSTVVDYVLEQPDKVRSVAFVSSLMGISEPDYTEATGRLLPPGFMDLPADFLELSPSYRAGNPDGVAEWTALHDAAIPGERVLQGRAAQVTWDRLETIDKPTLLMTGDSDLYTPPSIIRLQAQHLPSAEVHIIDEAGHSPQWEQPDVFNDILLAFLAELD